MPGHFFLVVEKCLSCRMVRMVGVAAVLAGQREKEGRKGVML